MFENGCEVLKCDFHLHTNEDKEFTYEDDIDYYNSNYVKALEDNNIRIGVITNHNKFNLMEYNALSKTARKKDIFLLPGVELSVKEGSNCLHTLIVFNPQEWLSDGTDYINQFLTTAFLNIPNKENKNVQCKYDLSTTISTLDKMGKDYFIIFAHVEQKSGLLYECDGGLIMKLFEENEVANRVLGFQKVRKNDNIQKLQTWIKHIPAFVEGSDPKTINEIGRTDNASYIKIGEFSYNAVKFALQDYEHRVFPEISKINHGYIKSIGFKGGKLDGHRICLSPELNTLIGIRGSGKSSILESVRYALGMSVASIDKTYKDDLVKNVLGSGGEISLEVVDKHGNDYEIKQIYGETPSIIDSSGKDLNISAKSIINNPLYFGQKDLSFTEDGYELGLLKKLVGNRIADEKEKINSYNEKLEEYFKQLISFDKLPSQIQELQNKQEDIKYKLKIFEEKGISEKLKKQTSCNLDITLLDNILECLNDFINNLSYTDIKNQTSFNSLSNYISEYNSDIFDQAKEIILKVTSTLKNIENNIQALKSSKSEFETVIHNLKLKIDLLKDEFAEIKREIKDDTIDPDSFVKYSTDYEKTKNEIEKLNTLSSSKNVLVSDIKKTIRERNESLQSIFNSYKSEISSINSNQSELYIEIEFKGNKINFKEDIKANFKGSGISESKYQIISENFSDFVAILEDYFLSAGQKLKTILTDGEFAKLSEKINSSYSELIKIECDNLVKILYHNKALKNHSIGQRASALILFILTQQDNDIIIIDQPEDDLDNQIIYKEVIHTIKSKKPYIQFIFATHNANIPVLGDAEKIIATTYTDEKIIIDDGNIDCQNTHAKIVDIMEGGEEAFNRRKLIYTSWQ